MGLDASVFKSDDPTLTEKRIELIIYYVIDCYLLQVRDKPKYSKAVGGTQFENYLRDKFVDDYLRKNVEHYKNNIAMSPNVQVSFTKESKEQYKSEPKSRNDNIDIYVTETELTKILSGENGCHFYFAMECKRINETKDYSLYITDINKFVSRPYESYRLPFEGQIAFVEDSSLTHDVVANMINTRLKTDKQIVTKNYLSNVVLHKTFEGSYISLHNRNHGTKDLFKIFHLLFDYSKLITD